ncbi:hypothetical protein [Natrinema saccharevitans]|uniref:hypothetical protein n=1 Tax=Natrinema saccharevitans TaxID=301967 RepID=UPI001115A1D8|nr:hypothetical protein [Natrinema saccharevitans]
MVQSGLIIPIATGSVVATFSVILTIFAQNRINKLRYATGVREEIYENKKKVTDLGVDLIDNIVSRETGMNKMSPRYRDPNMTSTSIEFDTSAYAAMKNSGFLNNLGDDNKILLREHYNKLELINQELNDREAIRANGKSWDNKRYNEMILTHERSALQLLLHICSEELFLEILEETRLGEQRLIGFKETRELDLEDTANFDTAINSMDQELEKDFLSLLMR